jgi:hypothetical protein
VTSPYRTITLTTNVPFIATQYTPTAYVTTSEYSRPTYTRLSDRPTPTSSQEFVPSATSVATNDAGNSGGGKMSTGAKAGIGVGAAVGGLALGAVAGFFFKRNKNKPADPTGAVAYTPAAPAPMAEDKGDMVTGKVAYVPPYPSHPSELSGASETRRYEMPG